MLVEKLNLGSVLKRLFTGDISEIISELLQNSQRGGATNIGFYTDFDSGAMVVADNGNGLVKDAGTPEQFLPLITVALSNYQNHEVAVNQKPMGVGIFSLLAHSAVSNVEIHSNGLALSLDTDKVWNDASFWHENKWRECISKSTTADGFTLIISADKKFCEAFEAKLVNDKALTAVARGYEDYLSCDFNYTKVDVSKPAPSSMMKVLVETQYLGNQLVIGFNQNQYSNMRIINWFGQLIHQPDSFGSLSFYYEVKNGTPLTPISPTRKGLVADKLKNDFDLFIRDQIRAFILKPENREIITPQLLGMMARFDANWFQNDCIYFTASVLSRDFSPSSSEEFEGFRYYHNKILTYNEDLTIFDPEVNHVDEEDGYTVFSNGISTFTETLNRLSPTGEIYIFGIGNKSKTKVQTLFWKSGKADEKIGFFFEKGHFAIGQADQNGEFDISSLEWQPITQNDSVFVFETTVNWDIFSAEDLLVGVSEVKEKYNFLESDAWAVWDNQNDEASEDELSESFRNSIKEAMRRLFDNAVSREIINYSDIRLQFHLEGDEHIAKLEFLENGLNLTTDKGRVIERVWLDHLEKSIK